MIKYLHTSAAIKSPVGLPNKTSFVKSEISAPLISDLTKPPLFFSVPALRSALAKHGVPCLCGESFSFSRTRIGNQ